MTTVRVFRVVEQFGSVDGWYDVGTAVSSGRFGWMTSFWTESVTFSSWLYLVLLDLASRFYICVMHLKIILLPVVLISAAQQYVLKQAQIFNHPLCLKIVILSEEKRFTSFSYDTPLPLDIKKKTCPHNVEMLFIVFPLSSIGDDNMSAIQYNSSDQRMWWRFNFGFSPEEQLKLSDNEAAFPQVSFSIQLSLSLICKWKKWEQNQRLRRYKPLADASAERTKSGGKYWGSNRAPLI